MKKTLLFISIFGIVLSSVSQQIQLKGVVTVQNSKTNTGKIQYVKNAEIEHVNENNAKTKDVTGDDGKFTLNIKGVKPNTQTQITVVSHGEYADYVVVNKKELQDITLGRLTPVSVYLCKKGELEQRQAEMIGINMKKLEERLEKNRKHLQNELEELKSQNDYLNVRYTQIKDSLDIISKSIRNAFERIKEYVQTMTLENLDDRDENYVKAYHCFSNGELDSVLYYLHEYELDLKYKKILQLQQESKKEKELAKILSQSAKTKEEHSENSMKELVKEWLLLARTYVMKNDYEKTMTYYEKAINADTLNTNTMKEYASYLKKISKFSEAEGYYLRCIAIDKLLEKENTETALFNRAGILYDLGNLHVSIKEPDKAFAEFDESLQIYRKLAIENPNTYLFRVADALNSFGTFYYINNEFSDALLKLEESLQIYRKLAADNPEKYLTEKQLLDMSGVLNNLGNVYTHPNNQNVNYSKAEEYLVEAVQIRKKLVAENPKTYSSDLALSLINLGIVYYRTKEFSKALSEYTKALKIYRELAAENPRRYLPYLAAALNSLGSLHYNMREFSASLTEHAEALAIRKELAAENPKAYLPDVAKSLHNLGTVYFNNKQYVESVLLYRESVDIYRELVAKNSKIYVSGMISTLYYLSVLCIYTKEYVHSEQYCREIIELDNTHTASKIGLAHALLLQNRLSEAETMYKELSKIIYQDNKTCKQTIFDNFDDYTKADILSEEQKTNVEKIKKIIAD